METPTQIQTMKTSDDDLKIFNFYRVDPSRPSWPKNSIDWPVPSGPLWTFRISKISGCFTRVPDQVLSLDSPHSIIFSGKNHPTNGSS